MEKVKSGKLNRKWFWILMIVIWGIEIALLLVGRNPRQAISFERCVALLAVFVAYIAAIIMRLRDAGKSIAYMLVLLVFPIFMVVIGCWESEKTHI